MGGLHDAADKERLREELLRPLPIRERQIPVESRAAQVARFAMAAGPELRGEVELVR